MVSGSSVFDSMNVGEQGACDVGGWLERSHTYENQYIERDIHIYADIGSNRESTNGLPHTTLSERDPSKDTCIEK
jgi:glutamate mutase epsilon subunit